MHMCAYQLLRLLVHGHAGTDDAKDLELHLLQRKTREKAEKGVNILTMKTNKGDSA